MSHQNTPVPPNSQFRNPRHSLSDQSLQLDGTINYSASPSHHDGPNQTFIANSFIDETHEDPTSGLFQSSSRELDLLQSPVRPDATTIHSASHQSPSQSFTHHDPNIMASTSNHGVHRMGHSQFMQQFHQPNQDQVGRHQSTMYQSYQPLLQQFKVSSQQPQTHSIAGQSRQSIDIPPHQRQFLQMQRMQSQTNHIHAQEMLAQLQQNQVPPGLSRATVPMSHSRPILPSTKGDTMHAVQRPVPILPATANMMSASDGTMLQCPITQSNTNAFSQHSNMSGMFDSAGQATTRPISHSQASLGSSIDAQHRSQQYRNTVRDAHLQTMRQESEITPQTSGSITPPVPDARKKCKGKAKPQQPRLTRQEALKLVAAMDRPPTRKSSKGGWTHDEDEALRVVVMEHSEKNWKDIAKALNNKAAGSCRNDVQCLHRWQKVLQPGLKKGPWTPEEDETITRLVRELGANKWSLIAKQLPGRIGKQCRERWFNHLNPEINKAPWTVEEEQILQEAHAKVGNKWAIIAKYLPGRTDNAIKNHYNATKRRAATRKGRKARGKLTPSSSPSLANTSSTTTPASAPQSQGLIHTNAPAMALPSAANATSLLAPAGLSPSAQQQSIACDSVTPISDLQFETHEINDQNNCSENMPKRPLSEITNYQFVRTLNKAEAQNKKRVSRAVPFQPAKRVKSDRSSQGGEEENSNPKPLESEDDENEVGEAHQLTSALVSTDDTVSSQLNSPPAALRTNGSSIPQEEHYSDKVQSPSRLQAKDSSDTSRFILEGLPEMRLDTPVRDKAQSRTDKTKMSQIVTIAVGDAMETPEKKPSAEANVEDERMENITEQNHSSKDIDEMQPNKETLRKKDSDERLLQSGNHSMIFATPPRGFFSTVPDGTGALGQESPNFAIRSDGTPGVLGMTPLPRSPLFFNSSPCGMSGYRGLLNSEVRGREIGGSGAALFTPGGLFSNTPGPRGRLTAICEGLGGGSSATPTKSGFRDGLLPPLFSPPPGATPGAVALAELKEGTATKGKLFDSELRLVTMGFTPAPAEDPTDGWTKRQLFNSMTPQQPRRLVDFAASDEGTKGNVGVTEEESNHTDQNKDENTEGVHANSSEGRTGDVSNAEVASSKNETQVKTCESTADRNKSGLKELLTADQADVSKEMFTVSGDTERL